MSRIRQIRAREIFDSRGNPTVEADVLLEDGSFGRASVPSGKSTGKHEALELRDGDQSRLRGRGVLQAVGHVHDDIAPALMGHDIFDQRGIDSLMINLDGTENKAKLGANAILSVSLAAARAASDCAGKPLFSYLGGDDAVTIPVPLLNIINGGAHADNALDIQEFMIVPAGFDTYQEAFFAGVVIYRTLKQVLVDHGFSTNVGDEGGFAPALSSDSAALEFLAEAVGKTQYKLGEEIFFALDCAASEYYKDGRYSLVGEDLSLDSEGLSQWYGDLVARFPIISIEDPFAEDDWDATAKFTKALGSKVQIVGDDLLVTNLTRLQRAIDEKTCNSILIKVNQIGTLSESMDAISLAHKSGFSAIISHRSGETEDNFISHLAVARSAGQLKSGAPCRTDRVCKYNELLRISEKLGDRVTYAGRSILKSQA